MSDPYRICARFYNPLAEPWLRPIKKQIVKKCLQSGFSRILEVGCGTGTLMSMLRKAGIQAVGLDLSPGMLGVSREIFRDSPSLIRGRGEFLPFPSQTFQGVVLSLMIHENPPLIGKALLQEALRVLAPKGTLFILDYQCTLHALGRIAGMVEYAIERGVGGDHFRNYRLFMQAGALTAFLAHLPRKRIHCEPVFRGSMALVKIRKEHSA